MKPEASNPSTAADTTSLHSSAFIASQSQPDAHLLRKASVTSDADSKTIKVECSEATAKAMQLKQSPNLLGWSHEVEVD